MSAQSRRRALAVALLTLPFLLSGPVARAAKRFSVVSIQNETAANLTISYRWGDEQWQTKRIGGGAKDWFAWRYSKPDENRSPDLHVRFDSDAGPSRYSEAKKLHGFAAEEENFDLGHKYAFRYDGPSKRYIELWDISPAPGRPAAPRGQRID